MLTCVSLALLPILLAAQSPTATWSTVGVAEVMISDNGTVQQWKATLLFGSAGHRFARLRLDAAVPGGGGGG